MMLAAKICLFIYLFTLHRYAIECLKYNKFSFSSDIWSFAVTLYEILNHCDPAQNPQMVRRDCCLIIIIYSETNLKYVEFLC